MNVMIYPAEVTHTLFMVFSIMAGLIIERCFSCYSPFIMLCNGLKMSEYEAYWLTDFPLMISLACAKK